MFFTTNNLTILIYQKDEYIEREVDCSIFKSSLFIKDHQSLTYICMLNKENDVVTKEINIYNINNHHYI